MARRVTPPAEPVPASPPSDVPVEAVPEPPEERRPVGVVLVEFLHERVVS